jgi:hypothetical protein
MINRMWRDDAKRPIEHDFGEGTVMRTGKRESRGMLA